MALQLFPQFSNFIFSPLSSTSLQQRKGGPESISSNLSALLAWKDDRRLRRRTHLMVVMSTYDSAVYKMNLNEYMVTLERPLGIRFALSLDGQIFVHSLRKGGNAERSKIIMVGDKLKKASDAPGGGFNDIKDLSDAEKMFESVGASQSLVLERPFSPYPVQQLNLNSDLHNLFNRGKVPFATWSGTVLASNLQSSSRQPNSGFAIFSPKFLNRQGWMLLLSQDRNDVFDYKGTINTKDIGEIVGVCSEENYGNIEWTFGSFPLEEYVKALERSKGELYYNHSLGMQYSKITEQIYVGSCIQSKSDVQKLSNMGITAVLNFQSESERANWGINSRAINEFCCNSNILMVNYPIRVSRVFDVIFHLTQQREVKQDSVVETDAAQFHMPKAWLEFLNCGRIFGKMKNMLLKHFLEREVDSVDLRKKLPFSVGLLLRLLRKNHRIFVTCTTGFDRSPACVIAYLHWIQDTALSAAHNFVTGLHSCRPDRPAIVWATWDLIAMAENGKIDGSPTHVVNFVWNNGREGEEVCLVGDFTGNWKESIKAVHKGGSRYEAEVRLRHGKYNYKFIVGGQWRHSTSLPTERDEHGNVNNVIRIGDVARIRPSPNELQIKDPSVVKVIERQLTEDERFMLAFAARRIAFAICPIKLAPK